MSKIKIDDLVFSKIVLFFVDFINLLIFDGVVVIILFVLEVVC